MHEKNNCNQFSQSAVAGTPLTWEALMGEFGYLAVRENSRTVIKGEYNPPLGMDPYTVKLLLP